MPPIDVTYRNEALAELNEIPPEFLPALLKIMRAFRESLTLPSATESFRQGWHEAMSAQTQPLSDLWTGLNAE